MRYQKRLEALDLWEVYDTKTGEVVHVQGWPVDGLGEAEAEEMVELLNSGEISPDPPEVMGIRRKALHILMVVPNEDKSI